MRISGIVPCLNEEGNIGAVYQRLTKVLSVYEDYEIIFIDDGSTDETLARIMDFSRQDSRVKYISFTRNYGLEAAFRMGFLYASFEWCAQYDADLQSPPEETYRLVEKAEAGYDAVFGIRKNRNDSLFRILGSKGQQLIASKVFHITLPKGASIFRLIKTVVARRVIRYPARTAYFIATVPLVTSNYTTVEVAHHSRQWGGSKWNLRKMLKHSNELFFGFSNRMLDISCLAALVGIGSLVLVLAVAAINKNPVLGLMYILLCILSGIQLFALAAVTQHLKYTLHNRALEEFVFVRDSNIEACVRECLRDIHTGGYEVEC